MMLNILKIALGVLGALFVVLAVAELPSDFKALTVEERDATIINPKLVMMTNFTLFVILLGLILIVGFFLFGMVTNPKKTIKSVLGYLASGLAFFVFYAMAKGTPTEASEKFDIAQSTIKATEAGLYLTIVMVVIGFALMLLGPLFRYIKK